MGNLKSKLFICSGLVAYLLFGQGCSDDKESDMPITIPSTEDTQPTLQKDGGSTTFSFNAPQAWSVSVTETTATRSASWLKVHPTSGAAGDATITITAEPNATGETRTAEVTIRSGSQTETVTVTQDYSNFITLEQREIVAGSEEQTVTLDITSTMEYEVLIPDSVDWITDGGNTRAVTTHSHMLTIAANSSYDPRQTEVVFRGKTDATLADTVKVYQAYKGAIVVAKNEYEVDAVGGALDFKVQTNLDLEVTVSADWIKQVQGRTRGLVEKDLFFDISPNESDSVGREATITIKGKDTGISQDILVRQTAYVPVLDTVIYRTGYIWEEAHDNLPLLYYAYVERERHYTNGKVYTDRFVDLGHTVESSAFIDPVDLYPGKADWGNIFWDEYTQNVNDSLWVFYHTTTIPDVSTLHWGEEFDDGYTGSAPGEWENYVVSKLYDDNVNNPEAKAIQDQWEKTSLPTGWYFIDTTHQKRKLVESSAEGWVARLTLKARFYDQFLVIDGKRIDFLAHLPENTWNVFVKEVPESSGHGMGIQYTYECKSRFMERNFYIACHEIVYSHNDPDEVFYYDYLRMELNGNSGGWNDADGYGYSMSSGRHPEAVFIIYANHQPIISTDCNWMTVEKIEQGEKNEQYSGNHVTVYQWKISIPIAENTTSTDRTAHLYLKDTKGNVMQTCTIIQQDGEYEHIRH